MNKTLRRFCLGLAATLLPLAAAQTAHAQDIKDRTIKFAFQNQKGHPQADGAQKFADLMNEKSGGKFKVRLFAGGTLGGDLQTVSALQGGTIEMTVLNSGLLSGIEPSFAVYDLPFLFNNAAEANAVVDGEIGQELLKSLEDKRLVGLGYWDLGFRHLTNNRHPVNSVDDIKGLKVRVVQSPVYLDLFNTLGANAVPLPFPELYTALEQRAVDGQENPASTILTSKLYEVQKNMTRTHHIYNPQTLLISKKLWDSLSDDERAIVRDASAEATAFQRKLSQEKDAKDLAELKSHGMAVVELTPEQMNGFRDAARPVVEKHSGQVNPAMMQKLEAQLSSLRN